MDFKTIIISNKQDIDQKILEQIKLDINKQINLVKISKDENADIDASAINDNSVWLQNYLTKKNEILFNSQKKIDEYVNNYKNYSENIKPNVDQYQETINETRETLNDICDCIKED